MLKIYLFSFLFTIVSIYPQISIAQNATLLEYKMQVVKNNQILDSSANKRNGKIKGQARLVTEDGTKMLSLDGDRDGIDILKSEAINAGDNVTYSATVRFKDPIDAPSGNKFYDAVFYKHRQFVLSRRGKNFYCNFHNGSSWMGSMVSPSNLKLISNKWYNLILSFNYHNVPSQGEIWTTAKLYVDGRCVASKTAPYSKPANRKYLLQLGKADGFGRGWDLHGDIARAAVYSKTLTEKEIQKIVLNDKLVKPGFEIPRELTQNQQQVIDNLNKIAKKELKQDALATTKAIISSLKSAALTGDKQVNFERSATLIKNIISKNTTSEAILKLWNKNSNIKVLKTNSATLSLLSGDRFYLLNMYGLKTSRETFRPDSLVWKCSVINNGKSYNFHSNSKSLEAVLIKKPYKTNNTWKFSVQWTKKSTSKNTIQLTAISNFNFQNRRLSYDLKIESKNKNSLVNQITFPCASLKGYSSTDAKMLVPIMSGVVSPSPLKNVFSYSGYYPTGYCSMQLGAYYDNKSGIYFATEDPYASSKSVVFQADPNGIKVDYIWKNGSNSFNSRSNAVFEIFNGNWYDAGLIYRKWLTRLNPPWWTKSLPRKDSPKWFRDNTLWIRFYNGENSIEQLKKIYEYMKLPFAVHWYSWWGDFDRDYPHFSPHPETYDTLQKLKTEGIRVVPYTNGRIWETKDRREEDWQFTSKGLPASVKDIKGKPIIENYNKASFGVMCPATKTWKKVIYDIALGLPAFGFDGVYYDQIAAARPRFCYDKSHGHPLGDHDTWFMRGYYPMFKKIRKDLNQRYPEAVLTSEDVSEPYAKIFDGMLPWRWMYNGQVPLFPLVYSGRTQFVGLSFGTESSKAKFPMLAKQLVNSEQLGWFSLNSLTSAFNGKFRGFVKRLMHIRYAMLNYFNRGMLGRPVDYKSNVKSMTTRWGRYGTGYVKTPLIVSNSWYYNNTAALVMVNTTGKTQYQKVGLAVKNLPFDSKTVQLHSFNTVSGYNKSSLQLPHTQSLKLEPYAAAVWIVAEKGKNIDSIINKFKTTFENIKEFKKDKDPFNTAFKPTRPTSAYKMQSAFKAPVVQGCIRQKTRNAVGHISSSSMIYFGTVDFGKKSPSAIEAYFAVSPKYPGHSARLIIDDLHKGKVIAEFKDLNPTGGWSDFKPVKSKLKIKVTGKHRVFMKFKGPGGMCNVEQWRALK